MATMPWKYEDEDGVEETVNFPAKWEICPRCDGEGTQDCFPGGITSSEWENEWDMDEREAYLDGRYDMPCSCCDGQGKVKVIDEDACTGEMAEHLKAYDRYEKMMYYHRMECEAERRMGA